MKCLLYPFMLIFTLLSCGNEKDIVSKMDVIEAMVLSQPEQALRSLRADSSDICGASDDNRARYILLLTLAKDKCFERHVSAADMEWAMRQMKQNGEDLDMAYYLLGRVYSDMNLQADAMRSYIQAQEAGDEDSHWALLACSNLGHLYFQHGEHCKAMACFEKTMAMAKSQVDTSMMVFAYRDMARYHKAANNMDESHDCLKQAEALMIQSSAKPVLMEQVYPEYISLLVDMGQTSKARNLISQLAAIDSDVSNNGALSLVIGRMYYLIGITDSAEIFLRRSMEGENVNARASAAMYLGEIEYAGGNYPEAYIYAMECAAMIDSATNMMQKENASLVDALSEQIAVERDNARLQMQVAVIIIIAILLIAVLVVYMKHRNNYLRRKAEKYKEAQQMMQRSSKQFIEEAMRNIEQKNKELANAKEQNDQLNMQLLTLSLDQERHRLSIAREALSMQEQLTVAFRGTPLYKDFADSADGGAAVNDMHWTQLETFLNDNANGFVNQLRLFYPQIKNNEIHVCSLIKLEFSNAQAASILCRTPQAVTNLRKRLYYKMFNKEGTADELNNFIRMFPY